MHVLPLLHDTYSGKAAFLEATSYSRAPRGLALKQGTGLLVSLVTVPSGWDSTAIGLVLNGGGGVVWLYLDALPSFFIGRLTQTEQAALNLLLSILIDVAWLRT